MSNRIIKAERLKFADSVFSEIERTIGSRSPETGGVLGGNPEVGITHFYFDEYAERTAVTYNVRPERINPIIAAWNEEDVHLLGMIHSHPPGLLEPSGPDIAFARRLLDRRDNTAMKQILIPIVQSSATGQFEVRVFAVARGLSSGILELPYDVVPFSELVPFPNTSPTYQRTFSRVRNSYDLHRLDRSMVVAIGCGGAAAFLEDLARSGVRFFVLIDPDVIDEENLATQQAYRKDIGKAKVAVLKSRILDINPYAEVTAVQKPLEALSDYEFRTLVFETGCGRQEIEARVLCGLTDSFWAQMRTNLLALHFMLPALAAQVYRNGAAGEIVFTHPDTTEQCMRCILSSRYKAYIEDHFQNDVGSEGAQYYATQRLNSTKFFTAMALLHHGTSHSFWGPMLGRIGQRNCIQIRCDPDVAATLGLRNFDKAFAGASPERIFCDETIFLPQHPESRKNGYNYDCPDCLATKDLIDSHGRFEDTRLIVTGSRHQSERPEAF